MKTRISRQKKSAKRKYTSEKLLKFLRMKTKELGEVPFMKDIKCDNRLPSITTYARYFGSYGNALKKAGLNRRQRGYDRVTLLKFIEDKAKILGRAPSRREVNTDPRMPSSNAYIRCFGGFRAAILQAGYLPKRERSDQTLLELFRKRTEELGRSPTLKEIDRDRGLPSLYLYRKRFGSIRKVQKMLGVKPNVPRCRDYDEAELIEMLKKKAKQLGKPPSRRDIAKDKNIASPYIYHKHFGSLAKAREMADCPSSFIHHKHTKNELIKMLRNKIKSLGRMPYLREIDADPKMSSSATYIRKFGSTRKMYPMMGFTPKKKIKQEEKYTKKNGEYDILKILNYLRKKANKQGKFPAWKDLNSDPNIPCRDTLTKLFGRTYQIAKLIGISIPKKAYTFRFITREQFKKEIIRFYKKHEKIPTIKEFQNSPETPPMSLTKQKNLTWNQLIDECGLPIHSRGYVLSLNREAEMVVKRILISNRHQVEDLTAKNSASPYSFKVDGEVKIHVAGATKRLANKKYKYMVWTFGIPRKKEFDYMVSVGFDELIKAEAIYVFPVDMLCQIAIGASVTGRGRYAPYRLMHPNHLEKVLGISKRRKEVRTKMTK